MIRLLPLLKNRRGVAAVEFAIVAPVMIGILLPITDIALVVFAKIEALQAMRGVAASLVLNPPSDVTVGFPQTVSVGRYNFTVVAQCGGAACTTATEGLIPKSFVLTSTVTPSVVVLYNHCGSGCAIWHTERFQ